MSSAPANWFAIANAAEVPSPSLLLYPDRAEENVRRMIVLAGGPARLRPHIKTHKMPELIKMQLQLGVTKVKCATIAEAEMTAAAGAPDGAAGTAAGLPGAGWCLLCSSGVWPKLIPAIASTNAIVARKERER